MNFFCDFYVSLVEIVWNVQNSGLLINKEHANWNLHIPSLSFLLAQSAKLHFLSIISVFDQFSMREVCYSILAFS